MRRLQLHPLRPLRFVEKIPVDNLPLSLRGVLVQIVCAAGGEVTVILGPEGIAETAGFCML
jgi:hypothetical protein